jgi:excisionase family DNA binding protein
MVDDHGSAVRLPHLVDIQVLAEHLGVAPRHVRRLVAEKRIPYVKWGHLVRFDPAEVAAWLETARVPGNERRRPGASDSQTF